MPHPRCHVSQCLIQLSRTACFSKLQTTIAEAPTPLTEPSTELSQVVRSSSHARASLLVIVLAVAVCASVAAEELELTPLYDATAAVGPVLSRSRVPVCPWQLWQYLQDTQKVHSPCCC